MGGHGEVWFSLREVGDGGPLHRVLLAPGGTCTVGRDTACGFVLAHERVSRRHASLSNDGSAITVRDLGSTAGTFRNGVRVEPTATAHVGDRVWFGFAACRIEAPPRGTHREEASPALSGIRRRPLRPRHDCLTLCLTGMRTSEVPLADYLLVAAAQRLRGSFRVVGDGDDEEAWIGIRAGRIVGVRLRNALVEDEDSARRAVREILAWRGVVETHSEMVETNLSFDVDVAPPKTRNDE
jgi:hypothetical protein